MATALVLAVIGATAMLSGGAANAVPPPGTLGSLTLTPATGSDLSLVDVTTSGGCPSTADSYIVTVNGPGGFTNFPIVGNTTVGISHDGPFSAPFGLTMRDAAGLQGVVPGEYDVTLQCIDGFTLQVFGTFTTAMYFTNPTAYTTSAPNPIQTPTRGPTPPPTVYADIFDPPPPPQLSVTPDSPVTANTMETLTASIAVGVFGPGSILFMDNDTNIGSSVPVVAGGASIATTLQPGTHTLTATFTGHCPTDPSRPYIHIACLGGTTSRSTSGVTYVVNPPPSTPSPSPLPGITDTTTTLQVTPNPGFTFFPEFLIARIAPADAVGTVQFFDGNTPLGGGRVPVFGGFAFLTAALPEGTHLLTAMFILINSGGCSTTGGFDGSTPRPCPPPNVPAFTPSTSAPVPLTVQSNFGGLGFWAGNTPSRALPGWSAPGAITFPHR